MIYIVEKTYELWSHNIMRQVHSSLEKSENSACLILPGHNSQCFQLQAIEMTLVDLSEKEFILKL